MHNDVALTFEAFEDHSIMATFVGIDAEGEFDLNGDDVINDQDAIYLLWQILFPEQLPADNGSDIDGNGTVNADDVTYLLWHTLFPDLYPL